MKRLDVSEGDSHNTHSRSIVEGLIVDPEMEQQPLDGRVPTGQNQAACRCL